MSRAPLWRALLALVILVTTGYYAFTQEPRLGLDLRGGTTFTLETRDSPTTEANAESTDRTLEVLRRRVDALGVAEPSLARSGDTLLLDRPHGPAEREGSSATWVARQVGGGSGRAPPTTTGT